MTEHDIQSLISVELSRRGCIVNRTNSGVFYIVPAWAFNSNQTVTLGEWLRQNCRRITIGHRGQSDLCGHRPGDGRAWYIEVKRPGEEPRENQERFLRQMRDSGALAGVAHSVEEAVEIVFGDMDEEKRENMARVCPKCGKRLVFKSSVGDKYSCANCLSVFSF